VDLGHGEHGHVNPEDGGRAQVDLEQGRRGPGHLEQGGRGHVSLEQSGLQAGGERLSTRDALVAAATRRRAELEDTERRRLQAQVTEAEAGRRWREAAESVSALANQLHVLARRQELLEAANQRAIATDKLASSEDRLARARAADDRTRAADDRTRALQEELGTNVVTDQMLEELRDIERGLDRATARLGVSAPRVTGPPEPTSRSASTARPSNSWRAPAWSVQVTAPPADLGGPDTDDSDIVDGSAPMTTPFATSSPESFADAQRAIVSYLASCPTPQGKSAILANTGVSERHWPMAIEQLVVREIVERTGQRRGTTYTLA